ncbi:monofunctional biosynthetic peptidoglycan transglycosylase [candidate division KSB1 bacterium]|nr:monofunctional biosynthetic peptidoglycan transglycosylase [candidate division KSB1 bacterium]
MNGQPAEIVIPADKSWRRIVAIVLRAVGYGIAGFILFTVLLVLLGRWLPPLRSSFMLLQRAEHGKKGQMHVRYHWVRWEAIPPHAALAVVAAEDQKFPHHFGFDVDAIALAQRENRYRRRPRGASTISQQTAKNLYLWPGRSYLRKGLEAYFTVLLELLWSKKRILHVYLNIAEFGPNIYGVDAAARAFWEKGATALTPHEAALLAAALPNPLRLRADRPSPYVLERAHQIENEMRQLGSSYLRDL